MAIKPSTLIVASTLLAHPAAAGSALLPDLVSVTPDHLNVVANGATLRFSIGIANQGKGALDLHPVSSGTQTAAVQWLRDAAGNVVSKTTVGTAAYHPAHKHWHMSDLTKYELRRGALTGPVVAGGSKITYCLIDWIRIDANGLGPDPVYKDCYSGASIQGISPGWVDQYHQSTSGQELPLPPVPGTYFLVNTVNPNSSGPMHYLEADYSNNVGWTKFELKASGSGWKVAVLASGGLDAVTTNR